MGIVQSCIKIKSDPLAGTQEENIKHELKCTVTHMLTHAIFRSGRNEENTEFIFSMKLLSCSDYGKRRKSLYINEADSSIHPSSHLSYLLLSLSVFITTSSPIAPGSTR